MADSGAILMSASDTEKEDGTQALERLLKIAIGNSGQARRVADFLLAWHNAEENGGWDPVDLWSVDATIVDDIVAVLHLIHSCHHYPAELGLSTQITVVWQLWRG
jgi:hypothetical protein